ncbi:MAG: GGDEF domain-containing protein [Synechococcaceae cyanobacterium]|nr:GGDEF domain-containing protein [Synechococcaceae cyanobacterium]
MPSEVSGPPPRRIERRQGLLRGRVHQSLLLEMVVATTVASALMALAVGSVVLRHQLRIMTTALEASQRQLSASLTSYEPLHNLQRQLQQASSAREVELALVVTENGRVLAASNNALVGQRLDQLLQQPDLQLLQRLFRQCPRPESLHSCLGSDTRLFVGPLPWIGGTALLARRQYPLALDGQHNYGTRATLITINDAQAPGREALILTLSVFLVSLPPLMVGSAGLMLRLRARLIPELLGLAQLDALSGIYNRRGFEEAASEQLHQAQAAGLPMSIGLIDVDHFKRINDTHGHDAGDLVIQEVSDRLRRTVRGADLVGRLGGDEFVILLQLPGEEASQAMQRILEEIRQTHIRLKGEDSVQVTLSVGVADSRGRGGHRLAELLAEADAALYVAKDRGRNQVVNLEQEAHHFAAGTHRDGWHFHGF